MARGQFEKVVIDDARKPGPIVGTVDEVLEREHSEGVAWGFGVEGWSELG